MRHSLIPDFMRHYLAKRDEQRAEDVRRILASLTPRERSLVKDAAVIGYVRGTMAAEGERVPKDSAILAEVVDACLAAPDLYPALATGATYRPLTDPGAGR